MAPALRYQHAAIRITHDQHLDWAAIIPESVFSMSCMEAAKTDGKLHTHTVLSLSKEMPLTTIRSKIQKHYPAFKGNERLSVVVWDESDDFLNYICKDYDGSADGVGSCKIQGQRFGLEAPSYYREQYWIRHKEKQAKKRKPSRLGCVDWCVKELRERMTGKYVSDLDCLEMVYEYYSVYCAGDINGNDFCILSFTRKIKFMINHEQPTFKSRWLSNMLTKLS